MMTSLCKGSNLSFLLPSPFLFVRLSFFLLKEERRGGAERKEERGGEEKMDG
jgi:hypothetical protein